MKCLVCRHVLSKVIQLIYHKIVTNSSVTCNSVNYEAKLDDGTVVSKADGVEFSVQEGTSLNDRHCQGKCYFFKIFYCFCNF